MKKIILLLNLVLLVSCDNNISRDEYEKNVNATQNRLASGIPFNMLWNDNGVTKRSFIHQNLQNGLDDTPNQPAIAALSDLSEADYLGMPYPTYPYHYMTTNGLIQSPNETAFSFKIISEGYKNSQYGGNGINYPGFAVWVQNGFGGTPLEFKLINSAKQLSSDHLLREVAIVFEHWRNQWDLGSWSFKKQYKLNELAYIRPKFDIKTEHFNNYQSPNTLETQTYLTADLRIEYWKDGTKRRTDLVGVIFSNKGGANGTDLNGNPNDNIFWQDTNPANPRILLHGYRMGITPNLTVYPGNWTTIEFNYKPLIEEYLPAPPKDCTYENAIIVGFDIYSSTRSADIDFSLKNIYLNSEYNF
ncbi:hypothetical protein G4D82_09725 [Flavobacterium sp. CYK-4]|uniref:hypothetical protein n=1 Tax=Flavobacterium lotistagni TaxID=2709660 RepID=UPI001408FD57|nr:hypothetical protein [Flavobacterium lotistagni]NHM07498.1 hypothetical protein [Flavobacterium lotistagni]